MGPFIGKLLSSSLRWYGLFFKFIQFVSLENLAILDLALSGIKGLSERDLSTGQHYAPHIPHPPPPRWKYPNSGVMFVTSLFLLFTPMVLLSFRFLADRFVEGNCPHCNYEVPSTFCLTEFISFNLCLAQSEHSNSLLRS